MPYVQFLPCVFVLVCSGAAALDNDGLLTLDKQASLLAL